MIYSDDGLHWNALNISDIRSVSSTINIGGDNYLAFGADGKILKGSILADEITPPADMQAIRIQTGAAARDHVDLDLPDVRASTIGISSLNISTISGARNAIESLRNAINSVSIERSRMGAYQNRLEHTDNNVRNYATNLSASESRIRDTDAAKEMMGLTTAQILAEAGQAMLAQANINPQNLLKLLT
ncbi:hypothetical protein K0T92_07630 [Paenibacillus oenotherae]|uniref:Flagellin C-terminal domain-containing protein n=2 Tax=Paenibacillus oenotherae TaxID=1435645 RepID=A0ABS7D482_9BACL|nr:hypothetical protein [Paenibacillus oenotherae]